MTIHIKYYKNKTTNKITKIEHVKDGIITDITTDCKNDKTIKETESKLKAKGLKVK